MNKSVLVIGGGIAGIQAAIDLGDMGFKAYLVEQSSAIGGRMAQLDKTFPTNDCSMCMLSPKLMEVARHPNVEIITQASVQEIKGEVGSFSVTVLKTPRYIDLEKCNNCNICLDKCPVRYVPQAEPAEKEGLPESNLGWDQLLKRGQEVKKNEITLTIDGEEIKSEEGMTILEAAKSADIEIPTLCYHPALSPAGACRVCSVEITSRGRKRIVTSCNYQVEDGLIVSTSSPDVIRLRKMLCELLLARCPESEVIQGLARQYGIEEPRFELKGDKCIHCGLCTRVCAERMGRSVIGVVGRGVERRVATPFQMTKDEADDMCMACGACAFVCPTGAINLDEITAKKPVPILSEFDLGLKSRAPVYLPFAQAVPNVPVIDRSTCAHFATGRCQICADLCPTGAIDFEQVDELVELEVGSIIVATGFNLYDSSILKEYGHGVIKNVISALEYERLISASGPTGGDLKRLSDGKIPKRLAFIQCVGSRDVNYKPYCSSVCCMYATKEAILAHEHYPELESFIFYTDLRAVGKGFQRYVSRAEKENNVVYVRSRPGKITEDVETTNPVIRYEDTRTRELQSMEVDLVVLCPALVPSLSLVETVGNLRIDLDEDGFVQAPDRLFHPIDTKTLGILACGFCRSPQDIPSSIIQASGAAARAAELISSGGRKHAED